MESIGLFTPPAHRMFMSWSTFWRSPEEKKLEPLLWLSLAAESLGFRVCAWLQARRLQGMIGNTRRARTGAGPRTPDRVRRSGPAPGDRPECGTGCARTGGCSDRQGIGAAPAGRSLTSSAVALSQFWSS